MPTPSCDDLRDIAAAVEDIRGWDFSAARTARDPVPWEYAEVVRRYLRPHSRVLDIATGGGEVFLSLAPHFGSGAGTDADPAMIQTACENTPLELAGKRSSTSSGTGWACSGWLPSAARHAASKETSTGSC